MDWQRTRDPRGSTVDEISRLSCTAKIETITKNKIKTPIALFSRKKGRVGKK